MCKVKFDGPLADLDPQVNPHAGCIDAHLSGEQQVGVITLLPCCTSWKWRHGCRLYCDPRLLDT